jgi:hypothetical protein
LKRGFLIVLAVAVLGSLPALAQTPPADNPLPPSKAKLHIGDTEFNFGFLPNDATVSHSFMMYNRGEDSLKILRVKPG